MTTEALVTEEEVVEAFAAYDMALSPNEVAWWVKDANYWAGCYAMRHREALQMLDDWAHREAGIAEADGLAAEAEAAW